MQAALSRRTRLAVYFNYGKKVSALGWLQGCLRGEEVTTNGFLACNRVAYRGTAINY
jgi:hypothetical protein